MDHNEEPAIQLDNDALADTAQPDDTMSGELCWRRRDRPENERIEQAQLAELLPHDPRLQRFEINGYIGKFRHAVSLR